jgi:hypothetical protein
MAILLHRPTLALGLLGTFALLVDVLQQSINKRAKVALTVAK